MQPPASLKALGDPIYEVFYGLTEQPFAITTDPRFFYLSASHQRAFTELLNGLRRREGLLMLTGETGTGKTTLCRAVLHALGDRTFSAIILNPYMTGAEVLRIILRDFGLVSHEELRRGGLASADVAQLLDTLEAFLQSLAPLGSHAVLVLDEAQSLTPAVLDQIRMLTGLEHKGQRLLQVVLCGQPGLLQVIKTESLLALNERITRRVDLTALPPEDIPGYIQHRLGVAGGTDTVRFDAAAMQAVADLSRGLPRRINVLCDRALQEGRIEGVNVITSDLVKRAARALAGVHEPMAAAADAARLSPPTRPASAPALAAALSPFSMPDPGPAPAPVQKVPVQFVDRSASASAEAPTPEPSPVHVHLAPMEAPAADVLEELPAPPAPAAVDAPDDAPAPAETAVATEKTSPRPVPAPWWAAPAGVVASPSPAPVGPAPAGAPTSPAGQEVTPAAAASAVPAPERPAPVQIRPVSASAPVADLNQAIADVAATVPPIELVTAAPPAAPRVHVPTPEETRSVWPTANDQPVSDFLVTAEPSSGRSDIGELSFGQEKPHESHLLRKLAVAAAVVAIVAGIGYASWTWDVRDSAGLIVTVPPRPVLDRGTPGSPMPVPPAANIDALFMVRRALPRPVAVDEPPLVETPPEARMPVAPAAEPESPSRPIFN